MSGWDIQLHPDDGATVLAAAVVALEVTGGLLAGLALELGQGPVLAALEHPLA